MSNGNGLNQANAVSLNRNVQSPYGTGRMYARPSREPLHFLSPLTTACMYKIDILRRIELTTTWVVTTEQQ